jgi:hypothetical protein
VHIRLPDAAAVVIHRQVLHGVRAAGLGWIVDDHVEDALS